MNSNSQKMSFWHFEKFWIPILVNLSHFSSPKFTQIQSWESLKLFKNVHFFIFKFFLNFISHKIEWQITSCIVDLSFTFWKFLEHSGNVTWLFHFPYSQKVSWMKQEIFLQCLTKLKHLLKTHTFVHWMVRWKCTSVHYVLHSCTHEYLSVFRNALIYSIVWDTVLEI